MSQMMNMKQKIETLIQSIIQTSGDKKSDWVEILTILKENNENSIILTSEIENILKSSNTGSFILLLNLIDYLIDEGILAFRIQISSKEFISVLLHLLKFQEHSDIQNKVLSLIKKWGLKYETYKEQVPNFYLTYAALTKQGICFPKTLTVDYLIYLEEKTSIQNSSENQSNPTNSIVPQQINDINDINEVININKEIQKQTHPEKQSHLQENINFINPVQLEANKSIKQHQDKDIDKGKVTFYGDIVLDLNPNHYNREYFKYVSQLCELLNLITLENEMINNADYNCKDNLNETINDIMEKLKAQSVGIENALGQILDERLMMISMGINEDIKKVLHRYEELAHHVKTTPFASSFETDYSHYNLNHSNNNNVKPKVNDINAQINKVSTDVKQININEVAHSSSENNIEPIIKNDQQLFNHP